MYFRDLLKEKERRNIKENVSAVLFIWDISGREGREVNNLWSHCRNTGYLVHNQSYWELCMVQQPLVELKNIEIVSN